MIRAVLCAILGVAAAVQYGGDAGGSVQPPAPAAPVAPGGYGAPPAPAPAAPAAGYPAPAPPASAPVAGGYGGEAPPPPVPVPAAPAAGGYAAQPPQVAPAAPAAPAPAAPASYAPPPPAPAAPASYGAPAPVPAAPAPVAPAPAPAPAAPASYGPPPPAASYAPAPPPPVAPPTGGYAPPPPVSPQANGYAPPAAAPLAPEVNGGGIVSGYNRPPLPTIRNAQSEGQCSADQSQWKVEVQCAIANAVMFDRRTGVTCDECLQKCSQAQDATSPWICRAATYDHRWSICDLFAVAGTNEPYFLTEFPGRDYFRFIGTPAPVAIAPVGPAGPAGPAGPGGYGAAGLPVKPQPEGFTIAPPEQPIEAPEPEITEEPEQPELPVAGGAGSGKDICGAGLEARYCQWMEKERADPGKETQAVDGATSADACAKACDLNEKFSCSSAVMTKTGCELSSSKADAAFPEELVDVPGSSYLSKVCLPATLLAGTSKIWEVAPNHILVGHVQEVADATSLDDCALACLNAEKNYSFTCQSAMWYPSDPDQNCLLNSETKGSQPEVFVPEDQGVNMLYFGIGREASKQEKSSLPFRDQPIVEDKWTKWSKCQLSKSGFRNRYLKCKEKDVRKCPKETAKCELPALQAQPQAPLGTCLAVRDQNNVKRCPHGMRTLANGDREYCRRPIDCPTLS